jgi:hypothetical protein
MRRTGLAGGDSGRGNHASTEVASRCLPNQEEHHGWNARNWQPMEGQIFIERLEPIEQERKSAIVLTDMATADNKMLLRKGRVLAVGPGKWIPGTWWYSRIHFEDDAEFDLEARRWEWLDGYRETPAVKPGQLVIFNARWNDLADARLEPWSSDKRDRKAPLRRPLSYRFDERIHLVQEADIAGILG